MVESIVTVVLEVAKCFVSPLCHHFGYLRSHKKNFDDLNEGVGKLKVALDKVQRKVDDALKNVEEIEPEVEVWQKKANSIIVEAEKLIDEEKGNNRCFKGSCPNLKTRYKHSKEASTKMEAIAGLLREEEKFVKVSHPVIHEDIRLKSTKDFEAFGSRNTTLKSIIDALNDANVHMVGVYGMGGVGKTTLVKEVGRQAKKDKLFDEVVFVEISENPNVNKIQEEIAGNLGLDLRNEATESQRANKLYARLKNEKILLIFDNIWTVNLDLETIGIPSEGRCKFLLTSRDRDVLEHMRSKSFLIDVLNEEEGRKLFKKMAGDYVENPEFKCVEIHVVKECAGLPVAIVTVAKALSNKELSEWKDSLRELRKPAPENFRGVLGKPYSMIEFSYNMLKDDKLKETFLLCSLVENNSSISDLLRYVTGLNILGRDITKMEDARNRVRKWVRQLKDSCLLLDGDTSRTYSAYDRRELFSMHDVVRHVAISIASRDQHVFTERNDDFTEWPNKDELNKCQKISLLGSNIDEPPEVLECPELEFFYMRTKNSSFRIPENFFTGVTKLGVLDFTSIELLSLPSSLCLLLNLQTLCLDDCSFGDNVDIIGQLKKLKILSLKRSYITQLPKEMGQLTQLRLLDLSYCSALKVIAPNVISGLSRLEELYMTGCSVQWLVKGPNVEKSCASLDELKDLPHLTSLEIKIEDENILPKDLFSKELQRYNISIGDVRWSWHFKDYKTSRTLKLKLVSNISPKELQGFKNVEDLYLGELKDVKNIFYELDEGSEEGFPQLRHLHIHNNPNFECIFHLRDSKPSGGFPILESLFLDNLINLEKVCYGQLTKESFCNLKIIDVRNCCKLENIFSFSRVKCLPQLEEIKVVNCQNIKEIFASEDSGNDNEVIDKFELRQLRVLSVSSLPQLASFYSEIKTHSTSKKKRKERTTESQSNDSILEDEPDIRTSLFIEKVVLPNLTELQLSRINSENIWDRQLLTMSCSYQNLTRLTLLSCERLKYAFPSSIVRSFEQLQHLEIRNCRVLKEIVAKDREAEAAVAIIFPRLTYLGLWNLPELETFYAEVRILELPMLKKLEVGCVEKIKVFSSEDHSSLENKSLFLIEKINRNLEELTLAGKSIIIMSRGQFPENYFSRLQFLQLYHDESTNIPLGILQRFSNMVKLELWWSCYEELFSCAEAEKYVGMLAQLKILVLSGLDDLKYMWKQHSEQDTVLQNLEILQVESCHKLISLVPSMASFKNLTTLDVSWCNGLTHVVTSCAAKSLEQLREMTIYECKMLVEIVADEGDVEKMEIVFKKLKKLSLIELSSLKIFCSGKMYTFGFPSLKELIVEKCPMMNAFYRGALSTPMFLKVKRNRWLDKEECWEGDINTTIQQLHRTKINSNSEELALSGDDMKMMLQGQFPEHYSCRIRVLKVIKDESTNIPHKILHRFNNLEKLILIMSSYEEIFSCEEDEKQNGILTNIKDLELWRLSNLIEMWQQDSQLNSVLPNLEVLRVCYCHKLISIIPSSASFENLTTLIVKYCDGLRHLITSSTAKSLVLLETMEIEHCEMMAEVVANEEGAAKEEIVFSKLEYLKLCNLESLTSFCSGNYTYKFPSLKVLTVTKCPKMKTFSEGVLSTPSLQKVKQRHWVRYEGCWEGDLNTTIETIYKKLNNI